MDDHLATAGGAAAIGREVVKEWPERLMVMIFPMGSSGWSTSES